jgi:hypothetical protein
MISYRHQKGGFIVFKNAEDDNFVPIECPICKFFMRNSSDAFYYRKYTACFECSLKWAEPNREKWSAGWRPLKKDIKDEVAVRTKIIPKITFDL